MASLIDDPNGRRRIQFVDGDGVRKTIRLGKIDRKGAEMIQTKVEALLSARLAGGSPDRETSRWLADAPAVLHGKLAAVGLVEGRDEATGMRLGAWMDEFFAVLPVKATTVVTYEQTRRVLLEYFTADRPLLAIGPGDGELWRQWMKDSGLAQSTIARRVKSARQIFHKAVKRKLIQDNPFNDVKAGSMSNPARAFFITRDMTDRVMDACPDAQWRLLFALSRYGGLRCPSEHLALKWTDVLWDKDRIRVSSPKTEHLPGGDCRIIPMFPELKTYLLEAFEQAEPGEEYVITRYRQASCNLRTQLGRIIHRAGLKQWPRLWHNLRATRQTELADEYPGKVVGSWIGNSEAIAMQHYLQVTDAHFDRAVKAIAKEAAQNPAQYTPVLGGNQDKADFSEFAKTPEISAITPYYHTLPKPLLTPGGFEPPSPP